MSESIYPLKAEMRGAVEAYLKKNHSEFFNKFTEVQWTAYYNENIHKDVSSFENLFLNLYIDRNINLLSKVFKTSSFFTRFIGYQNERSDIHNIRRGKLTVNEVKCWSFRDN